MNGNGRLEVSRRDFLKASAATGAGLVLEFVIPGAAAAGATLWVRRSVAAVARTSTTPPAISQASPTMKSYQKRRKALMNFTNRCLG